MAAGVGILGGTFDPIHVAHLRVAEEVREAFGLAEVRFVPAAVPPHKQGAAVTSAAHRRRMVERAIADVPAFRLWAIELEREGPSYTVDTLRTLRAEVGAACPIVFVLGRDQFAEFHSWREPEVILSLCDLAVVTRPPALGHLELTDFPVVTRDLLCYDRGSDRFDHASGHWVKSLPVTPLAVTSTSIRAAVRAHRSIRFLVPEPVRQYIEAHRLYASEDGRR